MKTPMWSLVLMVAGFSLGAQAAEEDYYKILEMPRSASKPDIKKAFRTLSKKFHPDVYKGEDANEKFSRISEAYDVLSDDTKRQKYDRFGKEGLKETNRGGGGDPFDFFFGGGGGGHRVAGSVTWCCLYDFRGVESIFLAATCLWFSACRKDDGTFSPRANSARRAMKSKRIDLHIGGVEDMGDRFIAAWKAAEAGRAVKRDHAPRAVAARYDRRHDRVIVDLTNGCAFAFPPSLAQELEHATAE